MVCFLRWPTNFEHIQLVGGSTQLREPGADSRRMQDNRTRTPSCWEPGSASSEASELDVVQPKITWALVLLETEIIAALDAPKHDDETLDAASRRKEHELGAVFARLTPDDSLALERRLTLGLAGDPIAARFSRLVPARRHRMVSFLSEMRRRQPQRRTHVGARHG